MTDDTGTPGGNSRAQFLAFAERMERLLDEKAAIDEDIKALKGEMKIAAFGKDEMKAFAQCVKELRRGANYQAEQLQLELVLGTFRKVAGLPTDLSVAQQRALAAAEELPAASGRLAEREPDDAENGAGDDAYADTGARSAPRGRLPGRQSRGASKTGLN